MAIVEVDETWFVSPRRFKLAGLVGSLALADGIAVNVWYLGLTYAKAKAKAIHGGLIPSNVFDDFEYQEQAISAGLVEVRDTGIYVRGYSNFYGYLEKRATSGRLGGEASLERDRNADGSFKGGAKSAPGKLKQSEANSSKSKHGQASSSSSSSSSSSKNKYTTTNARARETEEPIGGGGFDNLKPAGLNAEIKAEYRALLEQWTMIDQGIITTNLGEWHASGQTPASLEKLLCDLEKKLDSRELLNPTGYLLNAMARRRTR